MGLQMCPPVARTIMKLFVQPCECECKTSDDLTISYLFYTYLNTPSIAAF